MNILKDKIIRTKRFIKIDIPHFSLKLHKRFHQHSVGICLCYYAIRVLAPEFPELPIEVS